MALPVAIFLLTGASSALADADVCTTAACSARGGDLSLLQRASELSHLQASRAGNEPWSAVGCADGGHCVIPQGEAWVLDRSVHVETLTIQGALTWDTSKDGLELRAGYVLVDNGGHLKVGTRDDPMDLKATIHITKSPHSHPWLGHRFLGGLGTGRIDIHGRRLTRTWTLLSQTAQLGSTRLYLKDDPVALGWRVGDRIGVATTAPHTSNQESTVHTVVSVAPGYLDLAEPLRYEHWGGWREFRGRRFEMAAEVVNMERSVLITGDDDDDVEGLHTIMTGTGYMDMRYARVEKCGQRPLMGRYCLHFHVMKHCPLCVFQGNAVVGSQHVAITVHGTHDSTVDQNVIWDAKAVGLYVEDGNEMHNTFSNNAVICSWWQKCSVDWVGGVASQTGGAFWIGMTNHMIGNHIVGHEVAWWTPGTFRGLGHGSAAGRVCPAFTPFGEIRDNVMHDNARFGLYLDNQYPRNIKRDSDGFVTDFDSCNEFTSEGLDNGVVNEVRNQFDWHNTYVGHYALGDIQFINYTSVNNGHAMYWKQSKNFADGRLWHMKDCTFANDPSDLFGTLKLLGPSGPFTFGIADSAFLGSVRGSAGAIQAGQHCGQGGAGGPCNVQYLLRNVDFSGLDPGSPRIAHGVEGSGVDQAYVLPVFVAKDNSLGGYRSIVSQHLNGFGDNAPPGCVKLGSVWGNGYGCNGLVRRLNVWGPDSGRITISGPGYNVDPNWAAPTGGRNSGEMYYDDQHGGYGALVVVRESYTLSGAWHSDLVVEFSDPLLANHFGETESVWLNVGGRLCLLRSSDDRRFLSPMGRIPGHGTPIFHVLASHNIIHSGMLQCGGAAPANPPPVPSPGPMPISNMLPFCADLLGVKQSCSDDHCRVLTSGMTNRHCSDYCENHGLMCNGAWEEENNNCIVKASLGCSEIWPGTSDLICECVQSQAPAAPMPSPKPPVAPPAGPSPSSTTSLPTSPPGGSSSWVHQPGRNCWSGHGAEPIDGKDPVSKGKAFSLEECQEECEALDECDGAVMLSNQYPGMCWLRQMLVLSECMDYPDYDVWVRPSRPDASRRRRIATTPVPSAVDSWIKHPGVNCWTGRGAAPIEGKDPVEGSLSSTECKVECEKDAACEGFVMLTGQDPGFCWLRKNMRLSECVHDYPEYSLWERSSATSPGPAPTPALSPVPAPTPALSPVPEPSTTPAAPSVLPGGDSPWEYHPGMSCWHGHGAESVEGKDPVSTSISSADCMIQCKADQVCEGFVMLDGQDPGMCWFRRDIRFAECIDFPEYNLWIRAPETHTPLVSTTPAPAATTVASQPHPMPSPSPTTSLTTTPVNGPSWEYHPGVNCWYGRGAEAIAGKDPISTSISLTDCQKECEADVICEGIIMLASQGPGQCWLRRDIRLSECVHNYPDYNLWMKSADAPLSSTSLPLATTSVAPQPQPLPSSLWIQFDGANRACRGATSSDNSAGYYELRTGVASLDSCKALCAGMSGCTGIEYSGSGRCELWTREIGASAPLSDYTCLRHNSTASLVPAPAPADGFEGIDGGSNRACRGATSSDNSASYYELRTGLASLESCKALCAERFECAGIEYSISLRCELWTRKVGASIPLNGYTCLRYDSTVRPIPAPAPADGFESVDGGANRACRGATSSDNSASYYELRTGVFSLESCKVLCAGMFGCTGIEYSSSGRCELWTREVGASTPLSGYTCLRT